MSLLVFLANFGFVMCQYCVCVQWDMRISSSSGSHFGFEAAAWYWHSSAKEKKATVSVASCPLGPEPSVSPSARCDHGVQSRGESLALTMQVRLWRTDSGCCAQVYKQHQHQNVSSSAWMPDSRRFVVGTVDRYAHFKLLPPIHVSVKHRGHCCSPMVKWQDGRDTFRIETFND